MPRSRADATKSEQWGKMIRIGDELHADGGYDKAMQVFQKCLPDFTDMEVPETPGRTFTAMRTNYLIQGDHAEALFS